MIQSIDDLKSNIKDIGWNPFLVGGASGLGTYALTRLLGGNKWLAAALGLGVGTGAGWLQYNHNDRSRFTTWHEGRSDGLRHGRIENQGRIIDIALRLGISRFSGPGISNEELLSDIESKLRLSEVPADNRNRLRKAEIALLRSYLNDQPDILKKILDRDKTLSFLNQRGHRLFMPRDDRSFSSAAEYNYHYPEQNFPEQ